MSGVAQLFGGLNPAGGAVPSTIAPTSLLSLFSNIPQITNPFDLNQIFSIGLTPPEQDLVNFLGGQQDVRTRDIYSRLGLGGSTMEAQDLGGNELQRLAQSAGLINQNQQTALQVAQGTLGAETAAGNLALGTAQAEQSGILGAQGQQLQAQLNAFNQGQANLRNITSGLGNITSGLGSLAGNLFGA